MKIGISELERAAALYERGLYLQAYTCAQTVAPLDEWEGTAARVFAGRLAANLGGLALGRRLHLRAWRHDQTHNEARYFYARQIGELRGPFAAWRFLRRSGDLPDAPPRLQAEWLALHASMLARLRDFDTAEEWLARAEKLDPENAWLCVERADLLEQEDRYEDALDAAQRSLSLHVWYRPGVQTTAHLLILLDRDDQALELLTRASNQIESSGVVAQLAELQIELGHFVEAQQSLKRLGELSPLMDKRMRQWWHGQLSDAAYLCGDFEKAVQYATQSGQPFYEEVGRRLVDSKSEGRRVLLPVGFVRQHHMTCAPATLSTISRFWSMPADQLNLVETICYDGTPAHSQRHWADSNGWVAREFCVNWENAVALLDRGVPFTLTTVEPANAHLQVVIGYDSRRGTLLFRDPYMRNLGEYAAEEMLKRYRATGPRGMAIVPSNEEALLDGLSLSEATLYDRLYEVQQALVSHQRAKAYDTFQTMSGEAEGHRLTSQAQLSLAAYDSDQTRVLACAEKLLALFPDDADLKLLKLFCLRILARRSERVDLLKAICSDRNSDPLFWQAYARELSDDHQQHAAALKLLQRAFRFRPLEAGNFHLKANILWTHHRFDEALELYRFAACLKDTDENYVGSWFTASRYFHQTQNALRFLEGRYKRFGRRSSVPARTLFWAYEQVGQMTDALAVLESALELRPTDGDLLLFAAEAHGRHGNFETASGLLLEAEGKSQRSVWLRTAAAISSYRGETSSALALWRQVLEIEPLALDANRGVAQLLAETESRTAALEFLRQVAARFPDNYVLNQLLIEWLRDDPPAAEVVVRQLIEIDPIDAWARRELASVLRQLGKFDQGFVEAELALNLEPTNPGSYYMLGRLYAETGSIREAKATYREAIRLSVDADYAITELMSISQTPAERREALLFVEQELVQQVIFGEGLLSYREHARGTLEPDELLNTLSAALKARPDLWHAWSAMIHQLSEMHRSDEALDLARQATEKFPLIPGAWYDLSLVYRSRFERSSEIEALQQSLRINARWGVAVRQLAEAHQLSGEPDKGRALLEQAIARTPLDAYHHGYLADILWRLGEKDAALERIQRALSLEPGYAWAWNAVRDWSNESNSPEIAVACARDLTIQRAGEPRSWIILAQTLTGSDALPERLAALERAIALNPHAVEAHSFRVALLAEAGRFDEAFAAAHPPAFGDDRPLDLRAAAAAIEAHRGNVQEAIRQTRALVADDPMYYAGWNRLADWYQATGSSEGLLEASQEMVRLAPQYAPAFGYLASARLQANDRDGAKDALRHALALAPEYGYAGFNLFDLQLADDDLQGASETLETLRRHVAGELTTLRELQLATKRRDRESGERYLRELCFSPSPDGNLMRIAAASMYDVGWDSDLYRILDDVLTQPRVNPEVGALWVKLRFGRGECEPRLGELKETGELWRRASVAYLEELARNKLIEPLHSYLNKHREALSEESPAWGSIGATLVDIGAFQAAIDWQSDWSSRADLSPWMLWNHVVALRQLNRGAEAFEAGSHALSLPGDRLLSAHKLMLSLDEILAGDLVSGVTRFNEVEISALGEWQIFIHRVVWELIDFHRSRAEKQGSSAAAMKRLRRMARECPFFWPDSLLTRIHARVISNIAKADGSIIARVRAFIWVLYLKASNRFR